MSQSAVAVVGLGDSSFGAVSLIEAALAAGGQMTQPERTLFAQVVGQQNLLLEDTFTLSTPSVRAVYARAFESQVYRRLLATENKIENSPVNRPIPVNPQAFQGIAEGMAAAVQAPLSQVGTILSAQSSASATAWRPSWSWPARSACSRWARRCSSWRGSAAASGVS